MSSVEVLSMDLAVAVYPFILMLFSYFLVSLHDQNFKLLAFICNPFEILFSKWQSNFVFNTTTINTFAAFFNLSNIKFFSICFDILTPVKVYQFYSPLQVNSSWRLYYDPTIKYFSQQHRWYSIIALVIAFVFIIIPLLVLLFYSTRNVYLWLNSWCCLLLLWSNHNNNFCYHDYSHISFQVNFKILILFYTNIYLACSLIN